MGIRRVVPNIESPELAASRDFYVGALGFEVVMDMDWIVTFASPSNPTAQIQVLAADATGPVVPALSVEVDDVDAARAAIVERGYAIEYPLTDEPWGVRRFFARDPNGVVVNVVGHRAAAAEPHDAAAQLRGLHREIWQDVDPDEYVRSEREAWRCAKHASPEGRTDA